MAATAITKLDLFARLAEGHAAGITVVTPNRRLAQVLKAEFDLFQSNKNLKVWEDADILPFGGIWILPVNRTAWMRRLLSGSPGISAAP